MADFRYTLGDEEVEAFQMTEDMRFQEKQWPEWMHSSYLMTIDNQNWLNINDVETEIPNLGWIVRHADGRIEAVDYFVMEKASKVVPDAPPERDEPSEVDEDKLVQLAAKLAGMTVPEFEAAQAEKEAKRPKPTLAAVPDIDAEIASLSKDVLPTAAVSQERYEHHIESLSPSLHQSRLAYELLKAGDYPAAMDALGGALTERTEWCSCGPGQCDGMSERWACRVNSPLASS